MRDKEAGSAFRTAAMKNGFGWRAVAGVGSWRLDIVENVLTCSDETCRMFGIEKEAALDLSSFLERVHPEDRPVVENSWRAAMKGAHLDIVHRIVVEGEERWVQEKARIIFDNDGSPAEAVGTVHDITDRKRAELALLEERSLFMAGPTMVFKWRTEPEWQVDFASANVIDILGYSSEDLTAGEPSYAELMHREDLERFRRKIGKHLKAGDRRIEHKPYRLRRRDGSYAWVADFTTIFRNSAGVATHCLGYVVDITGQHESEERLDLAIRGTNSGLWDWHVQTGQVVFNERWAEIVGYALEELEPTSVRTWIDICHPDDLKLSNQLIERHFSGETDFYECEARMKHKDGSWVWVLDRGRVTQWGDDGKPVRMTGTHVDITDRKRFEELVHAERDMASAWSVAGGFAERLAVCLDTAVRVSSMDCGGIYLIDETDGSMRLAVHRGVSDFFVENTSYYPADAKKVELIRKGEPVYTLHRSLTSDENVPAARERLQAIAVVPILFQDRVVGCLNVASHTVDRVPEHARVALERIARYAGSFIAHEMQEEKIRQGWRDLDAFFNTIEDMVFILDMEGIVIGHNKVAAERLGYPADELIGRHVLDVHPEDRGPEARAVIQAMIAGETATCSIPLKTRNGQLIPVETKVVIGRWKDREVIFGISRDTTERDRLETDRLSFEQRRQQVEKTESLSRMAGAIAHHFNNILAVVIGNLELARNKLQDKDIAKLIDEAEKAVHRATQISGFMLSFIGMTRGKPQRIDFSKTVREHLPAIQMELPGTIAVESELPESGPAIDADPEKIRQILAILVTNAWESMKGSSGIVRISVDAPKASEIRRTLCFPVQWKASADAYACLTVADKGCGMDEETIGRIFDPFYTDKFIGRGIGLPVTLGIVKSSGGCVMVESKPGGGSVFRVFWPVSSK